MVYSKDIFERFPIPKKEDDIEVDREVIIKILKEEVGVKCQN